MPEARARYEAAWPIYRAIGAKLGEANCIQALGDVHVRLSELPEARARYEAAWPLYRAIGDKLGEANCIKALGDYYAAVEDYPTALAMLEEAAARYQALGLPHDHASAINSIANMYDAQGEHQQAVEAYTRAMALYSSPMWYRNRADQYLKLKDAANAAADIEAAARLQPDHPYLFLRLGDLALLQKDYSAAEVHYQAALERYPRLSGANFGLGLTLLHLGRPAKALTAYRAGLENIYNSTDLKEPLTDLESLRAESPGLAGVESVLELMGEAQVRLGQNTDEEN